MASMPDRVQRLTFAGGYPGTVSTVQLLGQLALEGAQSPRIRARARGLFAGLGMNDLAGRAAAVWDFILQHVTYLNNPLGAQHLTKPDRLDAEIDEGTAGECCASISVYAAALFGSVGILSRFVIVGWNPREPDKFRHVYLELIDKKTRTVIPFDPVGAMQVGEGFELGDSLAHDGLPIQRWSLDGKQLAANQLGDTDWGAILRNALDTTAKGADAFGPWGQLVGGVIRTGETVFDAASGAVLGEKVKITSGTRGALTPAAAKNARQVIQGGKGGKGESGMSSWLPYAAAAAAAWWVLS